MEQNTRVIIIGAVVAVLAQIILAPNMMLFSVMPNLLVVYSVVISMLLPGKSSVILAFVLGILADCLGFGPVGALAFLLLITTFVAQKLMEVYGGASLPVSLLVMAVLILIVEFCYAGFIVSINHVSFVDAFLYLALPESIYDCGWGLIILPLMSHFIISAHATIGAPTHTPPAPHISHVSRRHVR